MNSSRRQAGPLGHPSPHGRLAGVVAGQRQVQTAELLDLVGEIDRAHADVRLGIGQQARRVRQLQLRARTGARSAASAASGRTALARDRMSARTSIPAPSARRRDTDRARCRRVPSIRSQYASGKMTISTSRGSSSPPAAMNCGYARRIVVIEPRSRLKRSVPVARALLLTSPRHRRLDRRVAPDALRVRSSFSASSYRPISSSARIT